MDTSVQSTAYQVEKRDWMLSILGQTPGENPSVTLDVSKFTQGVHFPNGFIPSGTPIGLLTSGGLGGPYSGTTDEVQTVTEGGSGLTSFTLTLSGQTTGSIAAAATAATVKAALEALSNVGAGNVDVSGSNGGPYLVTFKGALADTDVAQMTATPTGGTGTVTVATQTAGGADASSDGLQVCRGLLHSNLRVVRQDGSIATRVAGALVHRGEVDPAKLPFPLDANGQADLKFINFRAGS